MPAVDFSGQSYALYTGDGTSTTFSLGFDFIQDIHVLVFVDDVLLVQVDDYTLTNDDVVFLEAPASGASIRLMRDSSTDYSARLVDYRAYGTITEKEMDLNQRQLWYMIEEARERDDGGNVNPNAEYLSWSAAKAAWTAKRTGSDQTIGGLADPGETNEAATKGYVDDIAEWGQQGIPQSWSFTTVAATTNYTLAAGVHLDPNYSIVSIDGVLQVPGVDYDVIRGDPDSTLSFTTAPVVDKLCAVQNFGKYRFLNSQVLGNNAVGTNALQNGSVTTPKLATDAVTESKIADDAVTTDKIEDEAVDGDKLAEDEVTWAHMREAGWFTDPGPGTWPLHKFLRVNKTTGNLEAIGIQPTDMSTWSSELANIRLSHFAAPNSAINLSSQRIYNLATPTSDDDAATKEYVDDQVGAGTGSKIVQLWDASFGSGTTVTFFGAGFPAWVYDSTYLYYTFYVSNFQWDGPGKLFVRLHQGGVWKEDIYLAGMDKFPDDFRGAFSFTFTNPQAASGNKPMIVNQSGDIGFFGGATGLPFIFGPADNMEFRAESSAIAAGMRVQAYGHKALL